MTEPLRREISPRWIVLRRDNGHFESLGSVIQAYDSLQSAYDRARELSQQHHGKTFVVCSLVAQFVFEPVMIEGEVKDDKDPAA